MAEAMLKAIAWDSDVAKAMPESHGQGPWPSALANGHGHGQWPRAMMDKGRGQGLEPWTMAKGHLSAGAVTKGNDQRQ